VKRRGRNNAAIQKNASPAKPCFIRRVDRGRRVYWIKLAKISPDVPRLCGDLCRGYALGNECISAALLFLSQNNGVRAALIALAFSFLIEFSQFYHAPWIDAIRATTIGGLVLGFTFVWRDLLCYTVGVGLGLLIDMWLNNDSGTVENQSAHG